MMRTTNDDLRKNIRALMKKKNELEAENASLRATISALQSQLAAAEVREEKLLEVIKEANKTATMQMADALERQWTKFGKWYKGLCGE